MLQCVAVFCRVLPCVAVRCSGSNKKPHALGPQCESCVLQYVAVRCSMLQCVAVRYGVLRCAAVCCSVLQCAAVCCSVLHCASVCCNSYACFSSRCFPTDMEQVNIFKGPSTLACNTCCNKKNSHCNTHYNILHT